MWFSGNTRTVRKRGGRGKDSGDVRGLLRSNTRLGDARLGPWSRLQGVVLVLLVLIGVALLGWLLVAEVGAALFWKNPNFTVRKLVIHCDGPMIGERLVRDYTGLREGINLFSVNLTRMRSEFLRKTPAVRTFAVARHLPDWIEVVVTERETLARLGRWGFLGVDREGRVFNLRAGPREVPVLTGFAQSHLIPGAQVDPSVLRGIEALDACRRSSVGNMVRIVSIDVAPKDYVELYLTGGERIRMAWDGMGTGTPAVRQQLERKLDLLAQALQSASARGRRISSLDLTFNDQYMPAQEY